VRKPCDDTISLPMFLPKLPSIPISSETFYESPPGKTTDEGPGVLVGSKVETTWEIIGWSHHRDAIKLRVSGFDIAEQIRGQRYGG